MKDEKDKKKEYAEGQVVWGRETKKHTGVKQI
jgi:hypothetical protein